MKTAIKYLFCRPTNRHNRYNYTINDNFSKVHTLDKPALLDLIYTASNNNIEVKRKALDVLQKNLAFLVDVDQVDVSVLTYDSEAEWKNLRKTVRTFDAEAVSRQFVRQRNSKTVAQQADDLVKRFQ